MQKQNNNNNHHKFWIDELLNDVALRRQMDEKQKLQRIHNWIEDFDREFLKGRGRKFRI